MFLRGPRQKQPNNCASKNQPGGIQAKAEKYDGADYRKYELWPPLYFHFLEFTSYSTNARNMKAD